MALDTESEEPLLFALGTALFERDTNSLEIMVEMPRDFREREQGAMNFTRPSTHLELDAKGNGLLKISNSGLSILRQSTNKNPSSLLGGAYFRWVARTGHLELRLVGLLGLRPRKNTEWELLAFSTLPEPRLLGKTEVVPPKRGRPKLQEVGEKKKLSGKKRNKKN